MVKFKIYGVNTLPTSDIDLGGVYLVKDSNKKEFKAYVRNNSNTDWIESSISKDIIINTIINDGIISDETTWSSDRIVEWAISDYANRLHIKSPAVGELEWED